MKWRLVFVFGLVAVVGTIAPSVRHVEVAHADEGDCGKLMPSEALEDFAFADGATGALTAAPAASIPSVAAGGATVTLGTTMILGAATVLSVFEVECRVLDWIEGDGAVIDVGAGLGPTFGSVTVGDPVACSTIVGFAMSWDVCRLVTFPTMASGNYTWVSNFDSAWYYHTGLILPSNNRQGSFSSFERTTASVGLNYKPEIVFSRAAGDGQWCKVQEVDEGAIVSLSSNICTVSHSSTWIPNSMWVGYECGNNYGSVCGAEPGRLIMLQRCGNTGAMPSPPGGGGNCTILPDVLLNPWPEVEETGWQRRVMVDVQCWDHDGDDSKTWVRYTGPTYWDTAPSARVRVPECPDVGDIPFKVHIGRVPTGLTPATGSIPDAYIVNKIEMPATYDTVDYPDYLHCMGDRVTCDPPELDEVTEVCSWGGVDVTAEYCNPALQAGEASPNPNTRGRVTTMEVIDPAPTPAPGEIIATTTVTPGEPPDDGGSGVTVNVPIDDGGEDEPRGVGSIVGTDAEDCFPDGWGWFSPVWIFDAVVCALSWAFVPSDGYVQGKVDDFLEELEVQLPFSLAFKLIDFATVLNDSMEASSASGCFDTGGTYSFGEYGSVPIEDVCIGGSSSTAEFELSTERRQQLAALFVFGVWFAVARHAFNTIRGVATGTGGDMFDADGRET